MECFDIPKKKAGRPTRKPSNEELLDLYKDLTSKEIAALFDVSPATVRVWICRLRKEVNKSG